MLETIAVMIVVGVSTLSGLVVGYVMGCSDSRRKRPGPRLLPTIEGVWLPKSERPPFALPEEDDPMPSFRPTPGLRSRPSR